MCFMLFYRLLSLCYKPNPLGLYDLGGQVVGFSAGVVYKDECNTLGCISSSLVSITE